MIIDNFTLEVPSTYLIAEISANPMGELKMQKKQSSKQNKRVQMVKLQTYTPDTLRLSQVGLNLLSGGTWDGYRFTISC